MRDFRKYLDKKVKKVEKKQIKDFKKFLISKIIRAVKKGDTETDVYKGDFFLPANFDIVQYIESLGLTCKMSEHYINISW